MENIKTEFLDISIKDKTNCDYYGNHVILLKIKYKQTDEFGNIDVYTYDNVPLNISDKKPKINYEDSIPDLLERIQCNREFINFGYGDIDMRLYHDPIEMKIDRIHTEMKELTLSEIEKQLGYKVKIINEK